MAEKTQQGNPDVVANRQQVQTLQNGLVPVRISAATEPTLPVGQLVIWADTNATKVYLVYNDPVQGQHKVELL